MCEEEGMKGEQEEVKKRGEKKRGSKRRRSLVSRPSSLTLQ